MTGEVESARFDGEGRLVAASARLFALNARAGGGVGAPMAVPQLAMLVRLAAQLRTPISRTVIVADGPRDYRASAHAELNDHVVKLEVSSWEERPARSSWLVVQPDPYDGPEDPQDWHWTTDARLVLTGLTLSPDEVGGLLPADVVGQPLTRFVRLIEDDEGDLPILSALGTRSSFDAQRAVRRDLPDTEFLLSGAVVKNADGHVTGYSGTASVVPSPIVDESRKDLPLTGPDFADRLGQALRAPLDRIIARADTIGAQAEGPLRRDYADYAGDIASAGRHLLALIEDLADLQAVDTQGFSIAGEPVDLADIARRAAGLLAVRASDKRVRIDSPDADEVLMARGDFHRILQILVNLLGNAVRYSPAEGMVWLRTECDQNSAIIVIADQGKGIDPADHERVFEKFERVDPSEPGGTGLGLYISRRLARAMGGDITLDSAPGQGARFVLTLPVD